MDDRRTTRSLAPVADRIGAARCEAAAGTLRIDLDDARRILARLEDLRSRTGELVAEGVELDRPLRFGDNWVGHRVASRLRGVAVDEDRGLAPVLRAFHQVLDDLTATVRLAAGRYGTADDEARRALTRCAP